MSKIWSFLFENAGKKIQMLAKIALVINVLVGVLIGIIFNIVIKNVDGSTEGSVAAVFLAVIIVAVSAVIGWLTTLAMHAFGELCESFYSIDKKLK